VIYVLDGAVPGAEDVNRSLDSLKPSKPFPREVKEGIGKELSGLPRLAFVPDRSTGIVGVQGGTTPGRVVNGGVLLTLGPIANGATRTRVGANLWINGLAGQWLTYVLKPFEGRWQVTGTTGPTAIS
jgi:hypothetical protein